MLYPKLVRLSIPCEDEIDPHRSLRSSALDHAAREKLQLNAFSEHDLAVEALVAKLAAVAHGVLAEAALARRMTSRAGINRLWPAIAIEVTTRGSHVPQGHLRFPVSNRRRNAVRPVELPGYRARALAISNVATTGGIRQRPSQ